MRLGEILLQSGVLNERQVADALEYSHSKVIPLGQVIKLLQLVSDDDLKRCRELLSLVRAGMPAVIAANVLSELRQRDDDFEKILSEKLAESAEVTDTLRSLLLSGTIPKGIDEFDDAEILWLDSSPEELLTTGDRLFEDENLSGAEQFFNTLRRQIEAAGGDECEALTHVLRRLANLYMVTDRLIEAEGLYSKILSIKETVNGSHDAEVASAMEDLADLFWVRSEYQVAQDLYLQSSTIHEENLPSSLADFVKCLKKLLSCSKQLETKGEHLKIGKLLTEAGVLTEEQLLKALKMAKQESIPLGALLRKENLIDEHALQSFLEVQALIADGVLSGEAAVRAYKASILAGIPLKKLLQDAGLIGSAQSDNKDLRVRLINELDELITTEVRLGPHHRDVAAIAGRVGDLHAELGNILDAENFYRRALLICNRDRKENTELLAPTIKKLGMVFLLSNRPLQAEPLLMEALELLQAAGKAESKEALLILQEIAILHFNESNYAMSWNLFKSAIALAIQVDSVLLLDLRFLIAFNDCAIETQTVSEVEELYLRLIKALRKSTTCNDRALSLLNEKLGDFDLKIGKRIKATAQFEIAQKLLSRSVNADDSDLQTLSEKIAELRSR